MEIKTIKDALNATVLVGENGLESTFEHVYASDLMSDVLAFGKPNSILLTGLATQQAVISAHMAEFKGVVFVRGKNPNDGSIQFAESNDLILLTTKADMYDACVKVDAFKTGKLSKAVTELTETKTDEVILSQDFKIMADDFANAGAVSTEIKSILKKIGFDPKIIRRVAISTYEAEMNVVMHAEQGKVNLSITPEYIQVLIDDVGKGIPDIEMALKEGYTTATDEMRAMGFGSGMGLPNINKNTDEMNLESEIGKGTRLELKFKI